MARRRGGRLGTLSINKLIPNALTILALCVGVTAMRFAFEGLWDRAVIAVVVAVALSVAIVTICDASRRETIHLMRNLGFNLLIVPKHTDMADFWSEDFATLVVAGSQINTGR